MAAGVCEIGDHRRREATVSSRFDHGAGALAEPLHP